MAVIDVAIRPGNDPGTFTVDVVDSPGGEASATVALDVEPLLARLPQLQQAVLASAVPSRRALPETERPLREIGHALFHTLLGSGDVAGRYQSSAAIAAERGEGLRVVLRIDDPALAGLPWEAMFDDRTGAYLCRKEQLVRHIPVASVPAPLKVSPPLRMLVVISSPRGLPPLDVEKEADLLTEALRQQIANGLVELHWAKRATWSEVQDLLIGDAWHVVHFIGHGDFDPEQDEGVLALVGDNGRAALVGADSFVDLLRQARPMPRLVVLNSCSGAATGQLDVFSGTAAALVRGGVSAVAAMQFEISDAAAKAFSHGFYAAIASGRGIDDALSSARVAILGANGRTLEWITPVLYLRGAETRLFAFPVSRSRRKPRHGVGSANPEGGPEATLQATPTEPADARVMDATADPRYLQAVAALFSERWEEAADTFTTLEAAYPNDQRIADRLREAVLHRDLAAWYREGVAAANRGDWNAAVSAFERVIAADSSYLDTVEILRQARPEQRRINLIDDLRRLHAGRQWQAALRVGEELAELDPASADPDGLISGAREALAEEEFAARYQNGLRQLDRDDWAAALDTFGGLERERPGYRDTPSLLNQLHQRQEEQQRRDRVKQLQHQVRVQAKRREWAAVVSLSEELAALDPGSADPDGLASRARSVLEAGASAEDDDPNGNIRTASPASSADGVPVSVGNETSQEQEDRGAAETDPSVHEPDQPHPKTPPRPQSRSISASIDDEPEPVRSKRAWAIAAVVAGILLVVGAAAMVAARWSSDGSSPDNVASPSVVPSPSTQGPTTVSVPVPGAQAWTETNVVCEAGIVLDIAATGTVIHNTAAPAESEIGPDGLTEPFFRQWNVEGLPEANTVALIGSLDGTQPFVVGSGVSYTCPGDGNLLLGINDVGLDNNSGQFEATITRRTG